MNPPPGPLALAAMAQLGYPDSGAHDYPLDGWRRVLRAACQDLFPELPPAEALRRLGHLYIEGFSRTIVGSVMAAAARAIGTERALIRIPSYLRAGRTGGSRLDLQSVGPCHWRLRWEDDAPLPEFVAGAISAIIGLTGAAATIEVESLGDEAFVLDIRWRPRGG